MRGLYSIANILHAGRPHDDQTMADVTFCTYVVTTDAAGESSLPVCSVPPPSKPIARTAPDPKRVPSFFRGFLVGWYGNTTLQQISEARRAALRQRRTLYRIDVVIDGGAYAPSRQYKTDLSSLGVIHVDLLPKETEAVFCEHLGIRTPKKATGYEVSDFLWKHPRTLEGAVGDTAAEEPECRDPLRWHRRGAGVLRRYTSRPHQGNPPAAQLSARCQLHHQTVIGRAVSERLPCRRRIRAPTGRASPVGRVTHVF